jgi:hypothetical protein
MREDMARVIVERPRIKSYGDRKGRRLKIDDLPTREGMRRARAERGERKQLNENLAPLRRYLEKQVGRPWDKVYSEIAAHLRVDSAVQQHVRDHLRDFVAITPRRDIQPWRSSRGGLWWQRLYVDPTNGLLCRTDQLPEEKARQRAKRNRPAPPIDCIALAMDCELRLIDGHWFEVRLAPVPEPVYRSCRELVELRRRRKFETRALEAEVDVRRLISPPVWDVAEKRMIAVGPVVDDLSSWSRYRRGRPDRRYAVSKRPLSTRELRRHGVHNMPEDAGGHV